MGTYYIVKNEQAKHKYNNTVRRAKSIFSTEGYKVPTPSGTKKKGRIAMGSEMHGIKKKQKKSVFCCIFSLLHTHRPL